MLKSDQLVGYPFAPGQRLLEIFVPKLAICPRVIFRMTVMVIMILMVVLMISMVVMMVMMTMMVMMVMMRT